MQKCIGVWWSRELNPIGTWSGIAGCFWCPLPSARLSLEKDPYNHLTMHNVYKLYLTVFLADAAAAIVQLSSWPIVQYRSKIHFKQVKILPSLESRILHLNYSGHASLYSDLPSFSPYDVFMDTNHFLLVLIRVSRLPSVFHFRSDDDSANVTVPADDFRVEWRSMDIHVY